ncbi:heavy metal translocating P-type ATPase [Prevotella melaninogenica]|uniref:heavy metal translocating P-type ATPase n=1 Tax=Prevotella melaninogenica TaxID=28132 RepID=UPI001C5F1F7E|nr:heavy metal translocating P-type ATPase [Prevotella melaninogenica]MBW4727796.1 heavy metal translocating P-type ATPase [Prevotella melaninogenica]MBW4730335.1 heavy metal translocating P-type ATPase [Prevotella melaninogenica]MBW4748731.1 heavy metal translocating P-type ATPase [Prevotella melaninogenica]
MKKKLIRIILTAVLLAGAWLVEHFAALPMWQVLLVYLVPYLVISYDVLGEAVEGIMEGDPFDENFLMSIATIGALLIGFLPGAEPQFIEGVFVMLFFQLGELFEHYAEDKARDSISELMDIRPDVANVERNGVVASVSPEEVKIGETVIVKPGEKIPLDGRVLEGASSLNTVALTGESMPRDISAGMEVISGCVNLSGVLKVQVEKPYSESTAAKIIQLVEEAGDNKSRSESFIRRFARVYTPIVVVSALTLAVIPPFFYDSYAPAFGVWLYRALTFLVVSCPCALVISIPLTFFAGIGGASHKGILIKGGNYMDALSKLSTVVFDKTGTLTRGTFDVEAIHPERLSEHELLHLAAHVERYSTHPIALALRMAYANEKDNCTVEDIQETAGQGITATVNNQKVSVGNSRLMATLGITIPTCKRCTSHAGTIVHVAIDGEYAGHIVISDQLKADALKAIESLKQLGVSKTVMLSGDKREVVEQVAEQTKVTEYYAELLPADKVKHVERLIAEKNAGETIAFVGDGINDAPVLARADVGIAMGALGSDAAIEAADVVLMDDKPSKIALAIELSCRTIFIAKENAWFAIGIKVAVLLLATFGMASMGLAVFADVGVMVLAVLNAMRAR